MIPSEPLTRSVGTSRPRPVLHISPHPDDELLGAPATLMALRDAGWRVINLACGLGREADRTRRRAELEQACRLAGFELVILETPPPIGAGDDLDAAQAALSDAFAAAIQDTGARLIAGPSPHDGHHAHEVVGRAIRDAVERQREPAHVLFWALWGELPLPNVLLPFGAARLHEIQRALAAHAGELARNRLDRLLSARAAASAVLGPERLFGFGSTGGGDLYAELLTDVSWSRETGWRLVPPHRFDPLLPAALEGGPEIGWWLHQRSARGRLAGHPRLA